MERTSAIVLSRKDHREADLLTSLYTELAGTIRAVALGVRKPGAKLKGHLEPLTKAEVMLVPGRGGWRLVGAILTEPYRGLNGSLEAKHRALRAAAFLEAATFAERDGGIWEGFSRLLETLDRDHDPRKHQKAELWFFVRMLFLLGYQLSEETSTRDNPRLCEALIPFESGRLGAALDFPVLPETLLALQWAVQRSSATHLGIQLNFMEAA